LNDEKSKLQARMNAMTGGAQYSQSEHDPWILYITMTFVVIIGLLLAVL